MKLMVSVIHTSKGKKAQKPITVKEEPQDDTRRLRTQASLHKSKSKSMVKVKSEPDVIKDEDKSDAAVCSEDEDMIKRKK
jgi:hypothetical protein